MTIRKLSSYVRSQLQSGLTITDATQCTLELVENSLDAKATAIAVRVNLSEFSIEVVDNGMGISPQDLKLIGKRYMTSKCHNFDDLSNSCITYGYRGQALASIAEICGKLSIKTRYKMNKETMIKIFRNGEPPSVIVSSKDRSDKGTTVTVHGFMSTMPVRRKRIFEVFDLQDIKNQMEYLAIIYNEVCFTLRDENKGEILLQTHKKTDPGLSLRELFGFSLDKFFVPINYVEKNIAIQGYVNLRRHCENNLKFLYVNNRIVLRSMVHKLLDVCIDKYFKENDNALQELPDFEGINLNLPKNKHNVYIVKIFCPYSYFVMFRNLRKTTVEFKDWDVVLTCIKRAVKSSLYKSSIPESDKINKIPADVKRVAIRNERAVGNLNCGIKGGLVKRKIPCGNLNQERISEDSGHTAEGFGAGQKELFGCNTLSESELVSNQSSKTHAPGHDELPKMSESRMAGEYYLNAKDNSSKSVRAEKIKNMECTDFLDFLAWFRRKLKDDSKIYNDFVKYKHNFRQRDANTGWNEAGRKSLRNKKLSAGKTKCNGVRKRTEEGNRKKEIKNSTLPRTFVKTRNSAVGNDKMKRIKGTKRNNCAQHGVELTSKKLKVGGKKDNNSSEDLILSQSKNSPPNVLPDCWFSHQNRVNLASQMDDIETLNPRYSKLGIDVCKKKRTFGRRKIKLKFEGTQSENNVGKGSKVNAKETNLEYKDFGVQTDRDFVITPSSDKPNAVDCRITNITSTEFQGGTYPSFKDEEVTVPISFDLVNTQPYREADILSSPPLSSQLKKLKTVALELSSDNIATKNIETISINNSYTSCERPSKTLSRGAASEKFTYFSKMSPVTRSANFDCGSQSRLVHTDPLNFVNFNSGNERCSSHSKFTLTERYNFMPRGLSQSVLDRSPINDFKTRQRDEDMIQKSGSSVGAFNLSGGLVCKSMLPCDIFGEMQKKADENMIYYEKELITANLINNKTEISSLGTITIGKEGLSNITVVGQWDKKLILALVDVTTSEKKFLAVFDQHAVDERIILEKLLKEFRTSDGHFVSVCNDPPIKCNVKESVGRLLPSFEDKLPDYGIKASVIDHENVLLHEIPLCFAVENILEKSENFFGSLLNNLVEEFSETRGTTAAIPKVYYDVISMKACKKAVKFNDVLSNSAMKKMMNDLAECQIPFQCAHGRPCVVPILDVEEYKKQVNEKSNRKYSIKILLKTFSRNLGFRHPALDRNDSNTVTYNKDNEYQEK